jgi:hypothetical protein
MLEAPLPICFLTTGGPVLDVLTGPAVTGAARGAPPEGAPGFDPG